MILPLTVFMAFLFKDTRLLLERSMGKHEAQTGGNRIFFLIVK